MRSAVPAWTWLLLLAACGCEKDIELFEEKRVLMDSLVSITIYATEEPEAWRQHVADAFDAMQRVETLMTSYSDSSQVGKINTQAGVKPVAVDSAVVAVMREAREIARQSDGAFDVTVLPLLKLWNFKADSPTVPDSEAIAEKVELVDFQRVVIRDSTVFLPEKGMGLDLGGVAKGYGVDRAAAVLAQYGYEDFMVEAGGDLRIAAGELTRGLRRIWVRHPRDREQLFAAVEVDAGAVATSGDYERYFELGGTRYHHILNPRTGYPSRPCVSVTILAETTGRADALSTAVFVLGPVAGMKLIEQMPGVEGLIIYLQDADMVSTLNFEVSTNLKEKLELVSK